MPYLLCIIIVLVHSFAQAQYFSSVTYPNRDIPKIEDTSIPQVRYAGQINSDSLRALLEIVASSAMEGRETGQPGNQKAGDYLVKKISSFGLKPGPDGSYKQPVTFTFSKWTTNEIFLNETKFKHLWDYLVFPTDNGSIVCDTEEIIFMGYGIDDPAYSDYANISVEGKVILINRGEPVNKDSISFISGSRQMSSWSDPDMKLKLMAARKNGAKAVLIIENDIKKLLEENRRKVLGSFLELGDLNQKVYPYPPFIYISSTMAKNIIGTMDKQVIKARKKFLRGKSNPVVLSGNFRINLSKETSLLEGNNIVGMIEGKSKKDEYVIVSAHYDHLGKRGDDIFHGADDNGSGTVSLLEMARVLKKASEEGYAPDRSVVFLWVTGEEKGLLGSKYYTEYPLFPLDKTIVNVNVDMVGRVDDKYALDSAYTYVIGSDRLSTTLHLINESVNQKYCQLTLDYTYNAENDPNQYYFRSDHYNFAKNGIPAIFYFSGTHQDYHRPSDTVEKINYQKMTLIGRLIFHTLWELANRNERIVVDVPEK